MSMEHSINAVTVGIPIGRICARINSGTMIMQNRYLSDMIKMEMRFGDIVVRIQNVGGPLKNKFLTLARIPHFGVQQSRVCHAKECESISRCHP